MAKEKIKTTPLAANLKALLSLHRISARKLSQIADVSPTSIADWLNGRHTTNFAALKRIAVHFSTNLDDLLVGTISADPKAPLAANTQCQPSRLRFEGNSFVRLELILPADFSPVDPRSAAGESE